MSKAIVRITFEIKVELTPEEEDGVDRGLLDTEEEVIYRAIEVIKEDFGGSRSEEIIGIEP